MADPYAWVPGPEQLECSNVARFMQRHGIGDLRELIERSTTEIEWFWDAVVHDLPIDFSTPYERVLDVSRGKPWARWFVGGRTNLAANCLDRHAAEGSPRRNELAILSEGEDGEVRRLTYRELAAMTNRLANALRCMGLKRGDRVGLLMPMVPEAVAGFLAIAKLGAVSVPIFSGFGPPAVAARLVDAGATFLLTAASYTRRGVSIDLKAVVDEAADTCPALRTIVVLGRSGSMRPDRDVDWAEAVASESDECVSEPMDSEDPLMLAYTSGTTGKPKGAVHVHGGLTVKLAQEVAHQVDCRPGDILHWFTDLGWIMGPWAIVGTLALGATLLLYDGAPDFPGPDRLWALMERHRATILGLSPTLVRALMRHGEAPVRSHDLSSLRILGSTGEVWNPDPWLWYFEHVGGGRCPVINFSGGTEVGACFLSPTPITPLKPCSLGGPALGMAVDVFGLDGEPVRGEVGELVCREPWPGMTRGIWNDPDRYIRSYWSRWPDVWVHGDWALIDADGDWTLHGRSDDTIKVAGKRLGPAEVESILVGHPAVAEAAAIGIPHVVKGEAIRGYVVLRPGIEPAEPLRSELRTLIVDVLGKAFAPEGILFVSALPKTRNGKVLRRAIRATATGDDPGDLSGLEDPGTLVAIAQAT